MWIVDGLRCLVVLATAAAALLVVPFLASRVVSIAAVAGARPTPEVLA